MSGRGSGRGRVGGRIDGGGRLAAAVLALGAVAVLGGGACGGGGGGGGGTAPPPPPPTTGITFTTAGAGGTNAVALRSLGATTSRLTLEVRAEGVTDLYGVAFDLTYPAAVFRLATSTEGSFLSETGSAATSFNLVEPTPGTLIVGVSRLGPLAGVSGSGPLLTLAFDATANGSGGFSFSRTAGFASDGSAIGALQFVGGSAQVNR
jgi:hypothetical protein